MVGLVVTLCGIVLMPTEVVALEGVVISQLQTGNSLSASNEAVELYNNTDEDQDITDWCVRYTSSSSQTLQSTPRYCFVADTEQIRIFFAARSYISIATDGYASMDELELDGRLLGSGMAGSGGHIKLVDADEMTIDMLGWGTAIFSEGFVVSLNPAPPAPTSSQVLMRRAISPLQLQDTGDNRADFTIGPPAFRTGGLYEVSLTVDLCGNMADTQEVLPDGYGYDEAGNCEPLVADICNNIELIQLSLPEKLVQDEGGDCYEDVCGNLDGLQEELPDGYSLHDEQCTRLESRELSFSEVLPNVRGSDVGHEFIELYNPNDVPIDLEGYVLRVGKNLEASYVLASRLILPGDYLILRDAELGFTLLNTINSLELVAPAGNVVSSVEYASPKDDHSWALIDTTWQFTDQVTPGAANLPMGDDDGVVMAVGTAVSPCAAGKYRHPITNRCRNIENDTAMLVACESDEYRNPETNRCRKVATLASVLTPCREGYERNPDTNRCRKVAAVSAGLTPCKTGYERNPDTNRCRKSVQVEAHTVAASGEAAAENSSLQTTLLVAAGASAASYGLYEWRSEIARGLRRIVPIGRK